MTYVIDVLETIVYSYTQMLEYDIFRFNLSNMLYVNQCGCMFQRSANRADIFKWHGSFYDILICYLGIVICV